MRRTAVFSSKSRGNTAWAASAVVELSEQVGRPETNFDVDVGAPHRQKRQREPAHGGDDAQNRSAIGGARQITERLPSIDRQRAGKARQDRGDGRFAELEDFAEGFFSSLTAGDDLIDELEAE